VRRTIVADRRRGKLAAVAADHDLDIRTARARALAAKHNVDLPPRLGRYAAIVLHNGHRELLSADEINSLLLGELVVLVNLDHDPTEPAR
jgi:hypothetical protein